VQFHRDIAVVRAELRGLYSSDIEDLPTFRPADGTVFHVEVGAFVGPAGEPVGEDLFYFHVCTVRWLEERPPPKGFEFLRHYLLLTRWDYDVLVRAVSDLCLHTEGKDWNEIATKLSRFGRWEYENHPKPAPSSRLQNLFRWLHPR
jgi:hypothetical protein